MKDPKQALKNYLKENPHMQEFQDKLDRMLKRCPNLESRMMLLKGMLHENLDKLQEATADFLEKVNKNEK